jgi:hypothetical protein
MPGGERLLRITRHQLKASGIGNIQAQSDGDGLVKKDGHGTDFAAQVHADPMDQGSAFLRGSGHEHFILTAKYLTN